MYCQATCASLSPVRGSRPRGNGTRTSPANGQCETHRHSPARKARALLICRPLGPFTMDNVGCQIGSQVSTRFAIARRVLHNAARPSAVAARYRTAPVLGQRTAPNDDHCDIRTSPMSRPSHAGNLRQRGGCISTSSMVFVILDVHGGSGRQLSRGLTNLLLPRDFLPA